MRSRSVFLVGVVIAIAVATLLMWKSCSGTHGGSRSTASGGAAGSTSGGGGSTRAGAKQRKTGPVTPASMAGRVTRASDGAGIAGAMVAVAPSELMAMFISNDAPTLVATTDASGAWKLPRVPPGAYVVAATAAGFLPGSRPKLTVGAGEAKTGLDVALTAGGTVISGTISDVGGGPIADARVTATKGGNMPELWGRADLVTMTGPDGTYALTLADGTYSVRASHDDYTSDSETVELEGQPVTVDFTLIPGAVIRGQVVAGDTGQPVPGALVRGESSGRGGDDDSSTLSDDSGNFVLRGLVAGTIEINALGRGYATRVPTIVAVGIGEELDGVKVVVDHAFSISGTVVRKGHKDQPLSGVTLGAFSIAAKAFGLALEPSDEDGSFEIVGLKPASYIVGAIGEGSVPEIGTNIEVVDKDVEGVIVEMAAGVTLSGRTEPAFPKAQMSIQPAGQIGLANMFEAAKAFLVHGETDATGAFTLKNVPPGAFKLKANAPDGHAGLLMITVADADQSGLVVKMESRASVAGKVIDTSGKPVAGSRVRANRLDNDHDNEINFNIGGGDRTRATTGRDGSFTIVGLEAGKYSIRASGSSDEYETFEVDGKSPKPSKARVEVELTATTVKTGIVLTVEARDGVIRGTVVTPDRKPAADAWVTAKLVREPPPGLPAEMADRFDSWGPTSPPVLTGADGRFTIGKLKQGTYNLVVEGPKGATRAEKKGVKTGDSVTIELAQLGTLTGKVTLGGAPVKTYDISCDGPGRDAERSIDSADGTYMLERMAPGKYKCSVDGDAGTGEATVDVPAGPATLDITLTAWASITGVVVSVLDKKPVVGVHVFAGNDTFEGKNMEQVITGKAPTTDASGRFTIARVPSGKGKVAIMPKEGFMPLGQRDYTATQGQKIDLGTIEVIPPREGDAGTFGMATNIEGDKLLVSSVKDDGPAAKAGIQVGDRITAINGQDVAKLSPMIASQLLASGNVGVGITVQLALERAGTQVSATLVSIKW